LRLDGFLEPSIADEVLDMILQREASFCSMTGDRNFLRLPAPLDVLPEMATKIHDTLPGLQRRFGVDLTDPRLELWVHAYGDGTRFGRHSDDHGGGNWRRRLSCVYYVHRRPRRFDGGHLVVYGRRGRTHVFESDHNAAVFFPSNLVHEVMPVECRSGEFRDSRFSINIWVT